MAEKTFHFVTISSAGKPLRAEYVSARNMGQALLRIAAMVSDDTLSVTAMDVTGFPAKEIDDGEEEDR